MHTHPMTCRIALLLVLASAPGAIFAADFDVAPGSIRATAADAARFDGGETPRPVALREAVDGDGGVDGRRSWLPVLYSAIVPGAGELSMGYTARGAALVAIEIAAWGGYAVKRNDGLDKRDAYEQFADENWSMRNFIWNHPGIYIDPWPPGIPDPTLEDVEMLGQASSGSGAWPGYSPWVGKDEDKQHYYENIGKYDWYISGWTDWDPDSNPYQMKTALRDEYRTMRVASNDALDRSTDFVYLSLATRVFSIVQTTLLVRRARHSDATSMNKNHFHVAAHAQGVSGGRIVMEYNFR